MAKKKIIIQIPLIKYLKEVTRDWGGREQIFLTKTYGGQVIMSAEEPAQLDKSLGVNHYEFDDCGIYMKITKEMHQFIDLKAGQNKTLDKILEELAEKEKKGEF